MVTADRQEQRMTSTNEIDGDGDKAVGSVRETCVNACPTSDMTVMMMMVGETCWIVGERSQHYGDSIV